MKKKTIVISLIVLLVIGAGFLLLGRKKAEARLTFERVAVSRVDISTSVTATGTLEAVTTVDVGTQVSGIVKHIYVDFNSVVRKGQVIAVLDRTNLEIEVATAEANLRAAQTDMQYQQKNYARYAELHRKELISANEYDVALQSYRKAQESVRVAQQSVGRAKTNLGYATITSPIDGVVISKEVEEGQTVASSFNTPTMFTIAKDLTDMRVIANVDEADIGTVSEGQRVTFVVDAFPDDVFTGSVTQVRQKATSTNNVVTYEVVISAPNADLKLKPGLTANITIYTVEHRGVLSVPSKALRFTPEPQLIGKKYEVRDCEGTPKVWTLQGNVFTAVPVKVGLSDGVNVELVEGPDEGTQVIADVASGREALSADGNERGSSPFMPGPRNRGGNKGDNSKK